MLNQKENIQITYDLYRHYDKNDNLLYVGISNNHLRRITEHEKHSHWYNDIVKITIEKFITLEKVMLAEKNAIKSENPLHNITYNNSSYKIDKEIEQRIKSKKIYIINKQKIAKAKKEIKEIQKPSEEELIFNKEFRHYLNETRNFLIKNIYGKTINNNKLAILKFNLENIQEFISNKTFSSSNNKKIQAFDYTEDDNYFYFESKLLNYETNDKLLKTTIDKFNLLMSNGEKNIFKDNYKTLFLNKFIELLNKNDIKNIEIKDINSRIGNSLKEIKIESKYNIDLVNFIKQMSNFSLIFMDNKNLKTSGSSEILNNYEAEINNYFNFSIFIFNDQEYIDDLNTVKY